MINIPFQNILGKQLQTVRRKRHLTQADLAQSANLSIPTVRNLERGRGNLGSWNSVLNALGIELRGRNLPPDETIGCQIATLRKRRGLGQRDLASLVGTTQPTLVALERYDVGRLHVLNAVLSTLGAGAYLAHPESPKPFYTHAGNGSTHHGWNTPQTLLERLYIVFGIFDLDPCSPTRNRRTAPVRARIHYCPEDDGLSLAWFGTVFVNPPYGRDIHHWTTKARSEVERGNAQTVVALLPARTDTRWWHNDIAGRACVLFLRGRLSFGDIGQVAPFPSALAVWGGDSIHLTGLQKMFADAWFVPVTKEK